MLYKEKKDIIAWLDEYDIKNYTLMPDDKYGYVVDVAGNVDLTNKNLTEIRIKFGHVNGNFSCSSNKLTSLIGCPQHVSGNFFCFDNKLTSLEGGPHIVGGHFWCHENKLTSLNFAPHTVRKNFVCNSNKLKSLEGMPEVVEGRFHCDDNPKLGELQEITDFKVIKAYFLSQKLAIKLPHDLNKNNRKIKL